MHPPNLDPCRQRTARISIVAAAGLLSYLAAAGAGFGQLSADGNRWLSALQLNQTAQVGANLGRTLATGDFDGDGVDDLALGAPGQNVGAERYAGQVSVIYSPVDSGTPTTQVWHQDSPGVSGEALADNGFGKALTSGDFDGDGFDDLVIAATENVGATVRLGRVYVLYGGEGGLGSESEQSFGADLASGIRESRDSFGTALASGDFDGDGFDDLAIGAHGATWAGLARAGTVYIAPGSASGLALEAAEIWSQSLLGAANGIDESEEDDRFGRALATGDFDGDGNTDLAASAIGEGHEGVSNLGAVNVVYGSVEGLSAARNELLLAPPSIRQPGHFGHALAGGDFDGNGADDLAVGDPLFGFSELEAGAGLVAVFFSEPGHGIRPSWAIVRDQQHAGEAREKLDHAGASLAAGDFDCDGRDDLVFGAYGEELDDQPLAGILSVLPGDAEGLLLTGQSWHQDSAGFQDGAEGNDLFGMALAVGDFSRGCDALAVGVPGEDLGPLEAGGAVHLIFSTALFRDGFESGGLDAWSAFTL